MSLKRLAFTAVILFSSLSLIVFIRHEYQMLSKHTEHADSMRSSFRRVFEASKNFVERIQNSTDFTLPLEFHLFTMYDSSESNEEEESEEDKELTKQIVPHTVGVLEPSKSTVSFTNSQSALTTAAEGLRSTKVLPTASMTTNSAPRGFQDELHMVPTAKSIPVASSQRISSNLAQSGAIFVDTTVKMSISTAKPSAEGFLHTETFVDSSDLEDDDVESLESAFKLLIEKKNSKASKVLVQEPTKNRGNTTQKNILYPQLINIVSSDIKTSKSTQQVKPTDDLIVDPRFKQAIERKEAKILGQTAEGQDGDYDDDADGLDDDDGQDDDAALKFMKSSTNVTALSQTQSHASVSIQNQHYANVTEHEEQSAPAGSSLHTQPPFVSASQPRSKRGVLMCNGTTLDSEVIYWKDVEGDKELVSPISPHVKEAMKKYLSFEYDQGGWNNMRMSMECIIIFAHAIGRTLVLPPVQHLYLLSQKFKTKENKFADELSFADFFNVPLLESQKGMKLMSMQEFLEKEGITGGLRGMYPPGNRTDIWGRQELWPYLDAAADATPLWGPSYLALPLRAANFSYEDLDYYPPSVKERYLKWKEQRHNVVFYDESLQKAKHIHIPGDDNHRLLKHHFSFAFFADHSLQRFYRRFVRDFVRYKDEIHCAGHDVVQAIRADSKKLGFGGEYYALHIRRGDFQFKDVKLSAEEIWNNLHFPDGSLVIPNNSFVYIATDDPDGVCKGCLVNRKPCEEYPIPKPVGCPLDPSWNAFLRAGWTLRFLRDYQNLDAIANTNPNYHGMVEVIVGTRAKAFAGTADSTFTGYIHRIRGFHGLENSSYYHSHSALLWLQEPGYPKGVMGWYREWRYAWSDDKGGALP